MKKLRTDTGGYALIYVLIIVLVLCAVTVTICTAALENYQAQEESVRQTRQLYQAEGEIEKFVALAEEVSSLTDSAEFSTENAATDNAKDAYRDYLTDLASGYTLTHDTGDPDSKSCKFTLTYKNDTVCIKTEISMALIYDVETTKQTPSDGTTKEVITYTAKVSKATHSYNTYTITHLTAKGG